MSRLIIAALALAASVSACATHTSNYGNEFSMETADSFRPGVTTEQEAITKLGKPELMQATPGGGHRIAWQYIKSSGAASIGSARGATIHEGIAIVFNSSGVMERVDKRFQSTGTTRVN